MNGAVRAEGKYCFRRFPVIGIVLFLTLFSCASWGNGPPGRVARGGIAGIFREAVWATPAETAAGPRWEPFATEITDGLSFFAGRTASPRLVFRALRVDLTAPELQIVVREGGRPPSPPGPDRHAPDGYALSITVSGFVRENGLLAGMNALPFDPASDREGEGRANAGVIIVEGEIRSPPHAGFDALVFYGSGGAAIVSQEEVLALAGVRHAAGGFHRILAGGAATERTVNRTVRYPRSAAGLSAGGRYLYFLVIDGRRFGSAGATEEETALLLRALGAEDGINFDGGGSSALALRGADGVVRVVNTPVHGGVPGRERAVAGCIGIGIKSGAPP
ncbi:MAG: phosphodiester glycosidase family protein [Spirochaetaceae bacterium]|jgi:hypothetical protein|nr:phosphodiester glycosidase family protein [Spirochaetaceae bacterium]